MSGFVLIAPIDAGIEKGVITLDRILKGQIQLLSARVRLLLFNESRLNIQIKCLMVAQVMKECRFGTSWHFMCRLLGL